MSKYVLHPFVPIIVLCILPEAPKLKDYKYFSLTGVDLIPTTYFSAHPIFTNSVDGGSVHATCPQPGNFKTVSPVGVSLDGKSLFALLPQSAGSTGNRLFPRLV